MMTSTPTFGLSFWSSHMRLMLKVDHREIDIQTGGSFYFKSTLREVHASLDLKRNSLWPFWEVTGKGEGVIEVLGWRIVYNVPEHSYYRIQS